MDTLGVQIAANDLPDAVVVRGNMRPSNVVSAIRDGMFWELDKYLGNPAWPGLAKLSKDRLANARIDGKSYALPIERELVQAGVLYRLSPSASPML
jgi:ABC-type glycerol-3-phosphate transport system substrate-binding protein